MSWEESMAFRTCRIVIARRHDDERYGALRSRVLSSSRVALTFLFIYLFISFFILFSLLCLRDKRLSYRPQSARFIIGLFFSFLSHSPFARHHQEKKRGLTTACCAAQTPADLSHFFENGHREGVLYMYTSTFVYIYIYIYHVRVIWSTKRKYNVYTY